MAFHDVRRREASTSRRWEGLAFRYELTAWLTREVGPLLKLEPFKTRPWATVWRAETMDTVWFAKQNCPPQRYEAALLRAIDELAPGRVVPVTAADRRSGLFVAADQGITVRDAAVADVDTWCRVAAAGARLQRELVPHAERLVALGLTVMAPEQVEDYVRMRVDDLGSLPDRDVRRLTAPECATVLAALPRIRGWAAEVGATGLPATLNHNDLHAANVFQSDGAMRFFDFADAMVTEPLAVLRYPRAGLADLLGCGPGDPRLARVSDAALEVWSDLAPLAELRAVLPAALSLARLTRCETWLRCYSTMTRSELATWGRGAADTLLALAADAA